MKFTLSFIFIMLLFCTGTDAQFMPKGHYLEGSFHYGAIFKHSPRIVIPVNQLPPILGGEISWEYQTYGKKEWHQALKYPRVGAVLSFQDFRDPRLGWGVGLMPFINLIIFKKGIFDVFWRMSMGLSYVSKTWDGYANPENTIIGSNLNNNTAFRLGFGIQAHKNFELRPSFSFTHYSNAASQFPNLGINVYSFHLGILYKNNVIKRADFIHKDSLSPRLRKVRFSFHSGLGIKEIGRTYRGPKYPVLVNSLDAGLFLTRYNLLKIGLTHEYNTSDYIFFTHSGANNQKEATTTANRFLFYVEDELFLGRVSMTAQLGYYFTKAPVPLPFIRLGLRYYPLNPAKYRFAPYLGARVKAHGVTAEYFDMYIGFAIR